MSGEATAAGLLERAVARYHEILGECDAAEVVAHMNEEFARRHRD